MNATSSRTETNLLHGFFDDPAKAFTITNPVTPRPWLNYLGNGRLSAFLSQNAGGLLWLHEPATRRLTRYHFLAAPGDRPGFYLYIRNRKSETVWNPHFAPTCTALDSFECRHTPGVTIFQASKEGICVEFSLGIAADADVLLWHISVRNTGAEAASLEFSTYMEFGLLEFLREALGWCYLKSHFSLGFDPGLNGIRYDYRVFESPSTPAMIFSATETVTRFECSRDAFVGRTGSLENPMALRPGADLSNSELPGGGHACAALGTDVVLAPGEQKEFGYSFCVADTWEAAELDARRFSSAAAIRKGFDDIASIWNARFGTFQVQAADPDFSRFVNIWNPYNAFVTLDHCRIISTDHMGTDGLRFRDTTQDALAVIALEPEAAAEKMRLVLEQQKPDGDGCFAFYPKTNKPTSDAPHRSDNVVWPVFSYKALIAETGRPEVLGQVVPFRDGSNGTIHTHLKAGMDWLWARRGPHGLPKMSHADWNDGLALFQDPEAESVMLGLQFATALRDFAELSSLHGREEDAAVASERARELEMALNSEAVWDGAWYRRLLLSSGKIVGGKSCRQGRIYLDVQPWAVFSRVGAHEGRGALAMDSVFQQLLSPFGLAIVAPAYRGFPEPEDPPLGSTAGTNENGGVFCHANTWAIIAECLLGRGDRAFDYYSRLLPSSAIKQIGIDLYEREPYVYVSTMWGPESPLPGRAGISWLTGTASWMYVAVTQYILGIRPTLEGLKISPCLPRHLPEVKIERVFRGSRLEIAIENSSAGKTELKVDGQIVSDGVLKDLQPGSTYKIQCTC